MLFGRVKKMLMLIPVLLIAGCATQEVVPQDYGSLTNKKAKQTIVLGMTEEEAVRVLGEPESKGDDELTSLRQYKYDNGVDIAFRDGKAIYIILESTKSGFSTKVGDLTVGKTVEDAKKAYGYEGVPGQGPFSFIHTFKLLIEGDKVTGQPLEAEGTPYYWIECYMDDGGKIEKLLITTNEMIGIPPD